jgi:hypothetical protein
MSMGRIEDAAPADPVHVVRRWEDSGAVWRVLARGSHEVTVVLVTCDGGEEVARITSEDPELVAYLSGRGSNADDARS